MKRQRGTGRIYQQPGCKLYYIQYYVDGKCYRESTGKENYQEARQILNRKMGKIADGTFVEPALQRVRISELAEDFLRDYRIDAKKSLNDAQARWTLHLEPFFGMCEARAVTPTALQKYVDDRKQEGASNATINRELAALKRAFNLGRKNQKVQNVPVFPHLQENNTRKGFLKDEDYRKLIANAKELWFRALIEVAYTYGWRHDELINLLVGQVDLAARVIRLEVGETKNKEGREVTMTANVYTLLTACALNKKPDDYVFTREDGKRVKDFRGIWWNACVAAGLGKMVCRDCGEIMGKDKCKCGSKRRPKYEGLIVHDFRRTAARNLRRAGVAEGVIMKIGGWKTASVFRRYDIVSQADISDAMLKLEAARKPATAKPETEKRHNFGHNQPSAIVPPENERLN